MSIISKWFVLSDNAKDKTKEEIQMILTTINNNIIVKKIVNNSYQIHIRVHYSYVPNEYRAKLVLIEFPEGDLDTIFDITISGLDDYMFYYQDFDSLDDARRYFRGGI